MIVDTMTGDNSDVTLTLSVAPVSENNVQVYFDGVYQSKANYSISGTTLTFSTAPATGVAVEAITHTQTTINEPAANTVTPAKIAAGDFYFSNNLGIGTSSPSNKLTINSTTGSGLKIYAADQAYARLTLDNLNGQAWDLVAGTAGASNSGFGIYDGDAGATRLQIDSSGNLLVGGTDNNPGGANVTGHCFWIYLYYP
jgi:hypothetical protein